MSGLSDSTAKRRSLQSALFDSTASNTGGTAPSRSPDPSPSPQGASTDAAAASYPSSTLVLARSLSAAPRGPGAPPLANREPPGALAMLARTEGAAAAAIAARGAAPVGALADADRAAAAGGSGRALIGS